MNSENRTWRYNIAHWPRASSSRKTSAQQISDAGPGTRSLTRSLADAVQQQMLIIFLMESQQHMTQKIDNSNVRLPCKPKKSRRWLRLRLRPCSAALDAPDPPVASPVERVSFWAYFYRLFYNTSRERGRGAWSRQALSAQLLQRVASLLTLL